MAVKVGSARIDENGKAYGGAAGDQTGRELSTQNWYKHKKGWRVFRAVSGSAALKISDFVGDACDSPLIGYDQWDRHTLYNAIKGDGFNLSKLKKKVECDCSSLVRTALAYAGITGIPESFRTGNMPSVLLGTGKFVELKGAKYTDQSAYLGRGDILVTKTSGHTVVVLSDGAKYEGSIAAPKESALGDRLLKNGSEGADVKVLQEYLIELGYDLGKWGADGDYGDTTELAVKAFQRDCGLGADGDYGPKTHAALMEAIEKEKDTSGNDRAVRIEGGDCWVRTAPNTYGKKLGVAKKGTALPYGGQTSDNGWMLVEYDGQNGWVSGKYGRVEG